VGSGEEKRRVGGREEEERKELKILRVG